MADEINRDHVQRGTMEAPESDGVEALALPSLLDYKGSSSTVQLYSYVEYWRGSNKAIIVTGALTIPDV